jgi:hypothetical protein
MSCKVKNEYYLAVARLDYAIRMLRISDNDKHTLSYADVTAATTTLRSLVLDGDVKPLPVHEFHKLRAQADATRRSAKLSPPAKPTITKRKAVKMPPVINLTSIDLTSMRHEVDKHATASSDATQQRFDDVLALQHMAKLISHPRCVATTGSGAQCRFHSKAGDGVALCSIHRAQMETAQAATARAASDFATSMMLQADLAPLEPLVSTHARCTHDARTIHERFNHDSRFTSSPHRLRIVSESSPHRHRIVFASSSHRISWPHPAWNVRLSWPQRLAVHRPSQVVATGDAAMHVSDGGFEEH